VGGLVACPACRTPNYVGDDLKGRQCRECRSQFMLDGDKAILVAPSRAYFVRRRLGVVIVLLGTILSIVSLGLRLMHRPSPLFGDCLDFCHPLPPSVFIILFWLGLILVLVGIVLRRKRWG
jgi:hypothetical protein